MAGHRGHEPWRKRVPATGLGGASCCSAWTIPRHAQAGGGGVTQGDRGTRVRGSARVWGHDAFLMKGLGKVRGEFRVSAAGFGSRPEFPASPRVFAPPVQSVGRRLRAGHLAISPALFPADAPPPEGGTPYHAGFAARAGRRGRFCASRRGDHFPNSSTVHGVSRVVVAARILFTAAAVMGGACWPNSART